MPDGDLSPDDLAIALSSPAGFASVIDKTFTIPPHIALINKHLVDLATGRIKRLMVFCPPRHGKSYLISRYFPAWFLGLWPNKHILFAAYETTFATSWSRQVRDLIDEWGEQLFNVKLRKDTKSAQEWLLKDLADPMSVGGMRASGAGGSFTGRGANLFIIDDPIKNDQEALSEVKREQMWNWYRSTARTRLEPGASIVLMVTRWHHQDLPGRILAEAVDNHWTVVKIPAIAEENDLLGRAEGAALWPERFPIEDLELTRSDLGSVWFSSMFQQHPTPEEGGIIRKAWFRYFNISEAEDTPPRIHYEGRSVSMNTLTRFGVVDIAVTDKETSDYTVVMSCAADSKGNIFIIDVVRKRVEGPDIIPMCWESLREHKLRTLWVEKASHGLQIIQQARREGLPVRELTADKSKEARMYAATPAMEAGHVYFLKDARWLVDLERELLEFPHGAHDDQADCLAYAVAYCRPKFGRGRRPPNPFGGPDSGGTDDFPDGMLVKRPYGW